MGNKLYTWGDNTNGRLGLNDTDDRHVPTQVGVDTDWSSVSTGFHHSLGIKEGGKLYAWGLNANGQLGLNDTDDRHVPTQVGTDTDWSSVSGGGSHSLGLVSIPADSSRRAAFFNFF